MSDSKKLVVVGAGVVGLCSAYYAAKRGMDVVVLDRDLKSEDGCSFGNAGMVVPSHFIPLAAPGMIAKGARWMMNPESPFYVKPRLSFDLMRWGFLFWRHANEEHTERVKELLAEMSLASRALFEELEGEGDFGLVKKGLLMLCNTQKGLDGEVEVARMANELGIKAEVCDARRVAELDPAITMDVAGGVWFEQDCHLEPARLMGLLRDRLAAMGVEVRYGAEVDGFIRKGKDVCGVELVDGPMRDGASNGVNEVVGCDDVVLAGGSWTSDLTKVLGTRLPLQAGKGYSLSLENPVEMPELCSIFVEGKVAVTPMGNQLRFAGTMEVGGNDLSVNARRVQGIVKSVKGYYPKFKDEDFEGVKPWAGLRPCSPDGLPFIGNLPSAPNVVVATGHAMMGLSLGPITGQMVADLVERKNVDSRLGVDRF